MRRRGAGLPQGAGGLEGRGVLLCRKPGPGATRGSKCGGKQRLPRCAEGQGDVMGKLGSGSSL